MKKESLASKRFRMIKQRHYESLMKAIKEKKIDEKITDFCLFIAKTKNYFTSSSCAGRIALIGMKKNENKKDSYFHAKWHSPVSFKEFMNALKRKSKFNLWFKLEPFIYHIGCKNLKNAIKVLEAMRKAGIKRGGIMVAKEGKFIIELQGTQELSFLVKENNEIKLNKKVLKEYLDLANKKLEKNEIARKKFENECMKILK